MLYCDAAFLVSNTSILIPRLLIARLVAGLNGRISGPSPKISRSVVPVVSPGTNSSHHL
jgi:hypothetical protein